jgi:hypothetical protein
LELNVDLSEHKDVWGEAIDVSFIIKVRWLYASMWT